MKGFTKKAISVILSLAIAACVSVLPTVCEENHDTVKKSEAQTEAAVISEEKVKAPENANPLPRKPEEKLQNIIPETPKGECTVTVPVSAEQTAYAEDCDAVSASSYGKCGDNLTGATKALYDIADILINDMINGETNFPETDYYAITDYFTKEQLDSLELTVDELIEYTNKNAKTEDEKLTKEDTKVVITDAGPAMSKKLSNATKKYMSEKLLSFVDANSVLHALLEDYPYDLFWFNKKMGDSMEIGDGGLKFFSYYYISASYVQGEEYFLNVFTLHSDEDPIYYSVTMPVSVDYYTPGKGYKEYHDDDGNPTRRVYAFDTSILESRVYPAKARADAIIEKYKNKSDSEKLKAYHDEICALTSYNTYAADAKNNVPYGDPWQMIAVFDDDESTKVVCEGYSKAFKYLCDNSSFTEKSVKCLTVTGTLYNNETDRGDHMWNIVHIGGKNYLVDVTNDDSNHCESLFMKDPKAGRADKGYMFGYLQNIYLSYTYDDTNYLVLSKDLLTLNPEYQFGDVNLDNKITVSDCVTVSMSLSGAKTLNIMQKFIANVDFDGDVTKNDAARIAEYCVSKITSF